MTSVNQGAPKQSLYAAAVVEADRHKWIVSERLGRDCGYHAWSEWWCQHWAAFCRHRRIEHVSGECHWEEFDDETFGHFYDHVLCGDLLLDRILDRVAAGWENLDIFCWGVDWNLPLDRTRQILEVVNINTAARMKPRP